MEKLQNEIAENRTLEKAITAISEHLSVMSETLIRIDQRLSVMKVLESDWYFPNGKPTTICPAESPENRAPPTSNNESATCHRCSQH